jgi:hypothetical protein
MIAPKIKYLDKSEKILIGFVCWKLHIADKPNLNWEPGLVHGLENSA